MSSDEDVAKCKNIEVFEDPGDFYFVKYSSIRNHHDKRFLRKICSACPGTVPWVATEKVHGVHFSIVVRRDNESEKGDINHITSGGGYRLCAGRRTGFVTKEEVFHNYEEVIEKYVGSAIKAFEFIVEEELCNFELMQLSIHGELFGGEYPHNDVERIETTAAVQKGLYYSNQNDFIAFDLHTGGDGGGYLDYADIVKVCRHSGFLYSEPLHEGTLEELLSLDNTFETVLPQKLYGLPRLEDNIAEGFVLRPTQEIRLPNGERAILKSKTHRFAEIDGSIRPFTECQEYPGKLKSKSSEMSKGGEKNIGGLEENAIILNRSRDVNVVWRALCTYVTRPRLANVMSKKNYSKKEVVHALASDALEEFSRSHNDERVLGMYIDLSAKDTDTVEKLLENASRNLVQLCFA